MAKIPLISSRKCINALIRLGFSPVGGEGSHHCLKNSQGRLVVVPERKEIAKGTLRVILKQAGITVQELLDNL